jgi:hypothetical protein
VPWQEAGRRIGRGIVITIENIVRADVRARDAFQHQAVAAAIGTRPELILRGGFRLRMAQKRYKQDRNCGSTMLFS